MSTAFNSCTKSVKDTIAHTFNGLTLALAYEVGIIDALLRSDVAMTSQDIGDVKQLKSRYVTEILNCLACAQIVEAERVGSTIRYFIAKENKCMFEAKNIPFVRLITSTAFRFQEVMKCVRQDGPFGFPYGDDPMAVTAFAHLSETLIDTEVKIMLEKVPGLKEKLELGIDVIEFGCGEAKHISKLAETFPKSRFTGSDYTPVSVERVRKQLAQSGIKNLTVQTLDILNLPDSLQSKFDFAFVRVVIHDLPDPQAGLVGLRKVLKPECFSVVFDVGTDSDIMVNKKVPGLDLNYAVSVFHCVPQTYFSEDSLVLGASWGIDRALRYLDKAGFKVLGQHPYHEFFTAIICQA